MLHSAAIPAEEKSRMAVVCLILCCELLVQTRVEDSSTMTDEDQSFRLKILRYPSASEQLFAPGVHDKFLQKVKVSANTSDQMINRPQSVHQIKGTNLFILNILTVMILQK